MNDKNNDKEISRRRFFSVVGNGAIATGLAGSGVIIYKYLFPNVLYEPSPIVKIGDPARFPNGTKVFYKDRKIFLFHDEKGIYTISAVCTHLNCLVNRPPQGGFFCPCHGSVFDAQGKVTAGPAPRKLDSYPVSLAGDGQLQIDLSKKVDANFRLKI